MLKLLLSNEFKTASHGTFFDKVGEEFGSDCKSAMWNLYCCYDHVRGLTFNPDNINNLLPWVKTMIDEKTLVIKPTQDKGNISYKMHFDDALNERFNSWLPVQEAEARAVAALGGKLG